MTPPDPPSDPSSADDAGTPTKYPTSGARNGANHDSLAWNPAAYIVGNMYFEQHAPTVQAQHVRDDLLFVYKTLLDPTGGTFDHLTMFQRLLREKFTVGYQAGGDPSVVGEPCAVGASAGPVWATIGIPNQADGETVVDRLNKYFGGKRPPPHSPTTLTHEQYVLLWHLLIAQNDLRLISPYDTKNVAVW